MFQTLVLANLCFALMLGVVTASPSQAGDDSAKSACRQVSVGTWPAEEKSLAGKELIAFASWCSSCKQKLLSTKSAPERFVLISVFEEPEQSVRAMGRLGLTSPCIYGQDLALKLGIKELPWSRKL